MNFFFFMAIGESLKLKKLEQLFLSSLCDCEWLLFDEVELDKKLILCGKVYIFANKLAKRACLLYYGNDMNTNWHWLILFTCGNCNTKNNIETKNLKVLVKKRKETELY